jgi:hypothetical protein|nr:MAG TPA: hypothetical protein [Caudoviricetes sp.]
MGLFNLLKSFLSPNNVDSAQSNKPEVIERYEEPIPEVLTYKDIYSKKKKVNGSVPTKRHFSFVIDLSLTHLKGFNKEQKAELKRKILQILGKDLNVRALTDKKSPIPELIKNSDWTWNEWSFWYPILKEMEVVPRPVYLYVNLENPTKEQIFRLFLDMLWRRTFHYADELAASQLGECKTTVRVLFEGEEELFEDLKKYRSPWTYPILPLNFVDVVVTRKLL